MQAECLIEEQDGPFPPELLAVIISILFAKSDSAKIEVESSKLFECFTQYAIELALEKVNRGGLYKATFATIETIFTGRRIDIESKG
jgi:hypothetical protein